MLKVSNVIANSICPNPASPEDNKQSAMLEKVHTKKKRMYTIPVSKK